MPHFVNVLSMASWSPSFLLLALIVIAAFGAGLVLRSLFARAPGAFLWLGTIVFALGGMLMLWGLLGQPAPIVQHPHWEPLQVESVTPQEQWSMWAYRPMMILWLAILGIAIVGAALWSKRSKSKFGLGTSLALMGLVAVSLLFFIGFGVRVKRSTSSGQHLSSQFVHAPAAPLPGSWPSAFERPDSFDHTPPTTPDVMSIDDIWAQMTAPRIKLDGVSLSTTLGDETPREVTNAAKVILSASLPGADPFTQGWLVNAAKAILRAPASAPPTVEVHSVDPAAVMLAERASPSPSVTHSRVDLFDPASIAHSTLPKPDWVVHPPKQVGNVHRFAVASGPFVTVEECRRELDRKMGDIVLQRAIELSKASPSRRSSVAALYDLGLGGDYVRRELCTDEFVDTMETSVGEMKQVYALMEFNESQDAMLIGRMRSYARQEGLMDVTLVGGGLLACVATLFGLLKADTWTRGYYTKRLFLGVPAAIITVLTLLFAA